MFGQRKSISSQDESVTAASRKIVLVDLVDNDHGVGRAVAGIGRRFRGRHRGRRRWTATARARVLLETSETSSSPIGVQMGSLYPRKLPPIDVLSVGQSK